MTPSAAPQHTTDANSSPPVTHYRTATVDDLDIFYREAGPANGSAIVLLHGFPTSSHMFRNLIPLLADRYHVIAPDYPGFGLSAAPDPAAFDYGFGRYADLMDNLLQKLGVQRFAMRRLTTIPGVGPLIATAVAALAPPAGAFRRGRDFAAWVGLTPSQRSSGGKQKLGATSKMGERTLRRLLIIGASSVVRQAIKYGTPSGSWLARMLGRKPRMLVIVALANKMARTVWALRATGEIYRAPVVAP